MKKVTVSKKLTRNQREYIKNVKRITKNARYLMGQGWSIDLSWLSTTPPKRVTKKQLALLGDIKRNDLKRRYGDYLGDVEPLPTQSAKKSRTKYNYADIMSKARASIANFRAECAQFPPKIADRLLKWASGLENEYGELKFGLGLQSMSTDLTEAFMAFSHDYGKAMDYFEGELAKAIAENEDEVTEILEELEQEDQDWYY